MSDQEKKCTRCGAEYPVYRMVLGRWICEECDEEDED